ncbi:MAG: endonuclease/exonuclease/phosphatase family protein, partial [Bacteroidales bacterium]|nr:endonuclease/exonuclease/phosphatase family protein [Bacteroidales bacterium]
MGFYNLENLFDTINDAELFLNEEFTPQSEKQWTSSRYHEKLSNIAFVISKMATDVTPDGVAVLGVCEVENRGVLEDLVLEPSIKERNYQIVHFDSPDARGIDVGLLYNPQFFEVTNSKSYKLSLDDDSSFLSRDQLVVTGLMEKEKIHIIVNHWPSRRGGEEVSRPKRNAAGDLSRYIVDSLLTLDLNAKILVMGDLNDDPVNQSVIEYLRAKGNQEQLKKGDLFNPMHQLYLDGSGTLAYRKKWNLFDMVIISQGLLGENKSDYKFYKAVVFDENFLKQKEGDYAGYPNRTYAGKLYLGGYSDH